MASTKIITIIVDIIFLFLLFILFCFLRSVYASQHTLRVLHALLYQAQTGIGKISYPLPFLLYSVNFLYPSILENNLILKPGHLIAA